jgi:hypothetical protein
MGAASITLLLLALAFGGLIFWPVDRTKQAAGPVLFGIAATCLVLGLLAGFAWLAV